MPKFNREIKVFLTFCAIRFQCVGQSAFQFVAVWSAFASFHQALEVVVQQAVGLQDFVQVDTIVLGGVLLLSADNSEDNTNGNDNEFHGFDSRKVGKG